MIILDTHVWIWLVSHPKNLSAVARKALEKENSLGVCAISCWEVAMLTEKKRLLLDRDSLSWIHQALHAPHISLLPLLPEIAVQSACLGENFHGDPADRLIVATALYHRSSLVTKDQNIRSYPSVSTIW